MRDMTRCSSELMAFSAASSLSPLVRRVLEGPRLGLDCARGKRPLALLGLLLRLGKRSRSRPRPRSRSRGLGREVRSWGALVVLVAGSHAR